MTERVSDTLRDVRLSMKLIGELDSRSEHQLANIDTLLQDMNKEPGPATRRHVAEKMDATHFFRQNALSEAVYAYTLVDSLQTDMERELRRLEERLQQGTDFVEEPVDQPHDLTAEPRYCICNDVSYGKMIACDNPNCPIEWYHLGCLGLDAVPKGSWYCPQCR